MNFGLSTQICSSQRLTTGMLDTFAASGIASLELFAGRRHFDYTERTQLREIAAWFRSHDVLPTLHAPISANPDLSRHATPDLDLLSRNKTARIDAMEEIKRALESAEHIPFPTCVLHLGLGPQHGEDRWSDYTLEYSLTAVEHLNAFAAPLGVRLLLENLPNGIATPINLLNILRIGHFDSCGICLDLGHAHLDDAGIAPAFDLLRSRIGELHLSDNHGPTAGNRDEHLWPESGSERPAWAAQGTIDWRNAYALAASLPSAIPLILEIADTHAPTLEAASQLTKEVCAHARRLLEEPLPR